MNPGRGLTLYMQLLRGKPGLVDLWQRWRLAVLTVTLTFTSSQCLASVSMAHTGFLAGIGLQQQTTGAGDEALNLFSAVPIRLANLLDEP